MRQKEQEPPWAHQAPVVVAKAKARARKAKKVKRPSSEARARLEAVRRSGANIVLPMSSTMKTVAGGNTRKNKLKQVRKVLKVVVKAEKAARTVKAKDPLVVVVVVAIRAIKVGKAKAKVKTKDLRKDVGHAGALIIKVIAHRARIIQERGPAKHTV